MKLVYTTRAANKYNILPVSDHDSSRTMRTITKIAQVDLSTAHPITMVMTFRSRSLQPLIYSNDSCCFHCSSILFLCFLLKIRISLENENIKVFPTFLCFSTIHRGLLIQIIFHCSNEH